MNAETAKAAGLMAESDASPHAAERMATAKAASKASETTPKDAVSEGATDAKSAAPRSADEKVPDAAPPASQGPAGRTGPSPFYLFAAGLVGALSALVLMFLAMQGGLVSVPDGRFDAQTTALAALDTRLGRVERALEAAGDASVTPAQNADALAALSSDVEASVSALRADLAALQPSVADAPNDGDAPSAVDLQASAGDLVAPLLEPLAARLDALEAAVDDALANANSATDAAPAGAAIANLEDLADASTVTALEADVVSLRQSVDDLVAAASAEVDTAQIDTAIAGLEDRVTAQLSDQRASLSETMAAAIETAVTAQDEAATARMDALAAELDDLTGALDALAAEPTPQSPDALARLGLALEGLASARDGGADLGPALQAARLAADRLDPAQADLAAAIDPLNSISADGAVSNGALAALFQAQAGAMEAAAPVAETGGLLGALEERARQVVTIRAPDGDLALGGDTPLAALDRLGALIETGRVDAAAQLFAGLPAAMQEAGAPLGTRLEARLAVDTALSTAQQALFTALGADLNP